MPDPTRKTVSATEASALFDANPYCTRWMLYKKFADGVDIERVETDRMFWGKQLQPLILERAARDLKLEIIPNRHDHYHRHARVPIGCTRDALIFDPSRGWGSLETKCIFDYKVWMQEWAGGQMVPRHYDIQLQQQMVIGDDQNAAHTWGVIAAWVCGEIKYFDRKIVPHFLIELGKRVGQFFEDVEARNEPQPFGETSEEQLLARLFDAPTGSVLSRSDDYKLAELVRLYADFRDQAAFYNRACQAARVQIIAAADNHETVLLPDGAWYRLRKYGGVDHSGIRIKVRTPQDAARDQLIEDATDATLA